MTKPPPDLDLSPSGISVPELTSEDSVGLLTEEEEGEEKEEEEEEEVILDDDGEGTVVVEVTLDKVEEEEGEGVENKV